MARDRRHAPGDVRACSAVALAPAVPAPRARSTRSAGPSRRPCIGGRSVGDRRPAAGRRSRSPAAPRGAVVAPAPPRDGGRARPSCAPAARAVDAAIATNAVLGVVMPSGCGIGGDAFWLIWDAAVGRQLALNGSGRAPAGGGRRGAARTPACATIPLRGPLSITVPGAVRSWGDAHRRFGRLSRDDDPRARRSSSPATASRPGTGSSTRSRRPPRSSPRRSGRTPASSTSTGPHGRPWRPGERVRLPALAATLGDPRRRRLRRLLRRRPRRAPGARAWPPPARRSRPPTSRATPSTGASRSRSTTAGVRVTTPPAQQLGRRRPRAAVDPRASSSRRRPAAFGPDGVTDPGLDPPRHRGRQAGDGRSRRAT